VAVLVSTYVSAFWTSTMRGASTMLSKSINPVIAPDRSSTLSRCQSS